MPATFEQIIELAKRSGIPYDAGSTVRPGAVTKSGKKSHHADGNAVDFMGHNQDALASFFMKFPTLEVFHYSERTKTWYGMSKGKPVDAAKNQTLVNDHKNHLHVAMSTDQVGPGSFLDQLRRGLVDGATSTAGALANLIPNPANVTEALSNVGGAMHSIAQSTMSISQVAQAITKLFLPSNAVRVGAGFAGVAFILIGILFLSAEIRESKA